MSEQVTCKDCGYGNPTGSKFCNNCGAKLPLSTHIICPNCTANNPIDRIFCDNCGTRLIQDKSIPDEEEKPGEQTQSSGKSAFSLPTRRPGETGDLDPSNVPDWLRTGETKDDEDDWTKFDASSLPRPEELTPKRETGDLPDWLLTESDATPIIDAPSVISTELYQDLVERGEGPDLSDLIEESEDADLPSWLQDASPPSKPTSGEDIQMPSSPNDNKPETADTGITDWLSDDDWEDSEQGFPAEAEEESSSLTSWLSETSEQDTPSSTTPEEDDWFADFSDDSTPQSDDSDNSITGWLTDFDEIEESDDFPAESELEDNDDDIGSLTAWLSEDAFAEDTTDTPFAEEDVGDRLTSWLSDFDDSDADDSLEEDDKTSTFPEEDTGSLTAWLSEDALTDDEMPDSSFEEPDVSERLTSWLSDFDDSDIGADDSREESPAPTEDSGSLTAWLSEDALTDDEISDSSFEEPDLSDRLTSWLSDFDDGNTEAENSEPVTSDGVDDTGSLTAWLSEDTFADETAVDDQIEKPEAISSESSSLTAWLAEDALDELEDSEEFSDEPELPQQQESKVDITSDLLQAWNADHDEDAEEDGFDWLSDEVFPETDGSSEDDSELDWFDETDEEFASVFTTELSEDTALPDWLADEDVEPEDFLSQIDNAEEDWQQSFAEEQQTAESDLDWLQETGSLRLPPEIQKEIEPTAKEILAQESDQEAIDMTSSEFGFQTEEPDWLADLTSYDNSELTADHASELPEDLTESSGDEQPDLEEFAPDAINQPEETQSDEPPIAPDEEEWEAERELSESDDVSEDLPEWLSQLDLPKEDESAIVDDEDIIPSDMPQWLSEMRPGQSDPNLPSISDQIPQTLSGVPPELAGADLPDWLQQSNIQEMASAADFIEANQDALPDWLGEGLELDGSVSDAGLFDAESGGIFDASGSSDEWSAMLNDLSEAQPLEETIHKAEIPEWILGLKPTELTGQKAPEKLDEPAEEMGPLSGLRGVVSVAPVVGIQHVLTPEKPTVLDRNHEEKMMLLHQLTQDDAETQTATAKSSRNFTNFIRVLFALILVVVISLGLRGVDVLTLPQTVPTPAADLHQAVAEIEGETVLVAFDYTPAMAGELNPIADTLLVELTNNESPVLTISQSPAGSTIALSMTASNELATDLGYLPGGPIGLRELGICLNSTNSCDTLSGESIDSELQDQLADVALIIVLTSDRENLVNWVEQVGTSSGIPVAAGVTQALTPVAKPYYATGQLTGLLNGIADTAVYQREYDIDATLDAIPVYNAQILAQLTAVIILIIGLLLYGSAAIIEKRKQA